MSQILPRVLRGEVVSPPPLWFMRQAGRFLPEYRVLREKATFEQLLADPDRREAMGGSGRRFVEGWVSPAAVGEAYERLFDAVARGPKA